MKIRICPNCGYHTKNNDRFCPNCGYPLNPHKSKLNSYEYYNPYNFDENKYMYYKLSQEYYHNHLKDSLRIAKAHRKEDLHFFIIDIITIVITIVALIFVVYYSFF